jgi:hypothetical protein
MIVYKCDLCSEVRECSQREIEQTEYDICADCWNALADKLKDKGRPKRSEKLSVSHSPVVVPQQPVQEPRRPFPGQPPDIVAGPGQVN